MAGLKLDAIDIRILAEIQRNGRITKLALAERVGLSATPCWTRLARLEEAGVIAGYHARLNARALGTLATVFVEVKLGSHRQADFERFERAVRDIPEIVSCWAVGGGIDYILRVVTRDIDAYQRLVDDLLQREVGIDQYFTYIMTKSVKDDTALPVEQLAASAEEGAER